MKRIILIALTVLFAATAGISKNGDNLKLEAIGSATASNLYLTYLTIGVIADSYTKSVYDNKRTVSFVQATIAQAGAQKKNLQKLLDNKQIPNNDLVIVKKMIDCYGLLIDEGNYFIDYVNTKSKNSLGSYDSKRNQAWTLIKNIMGIR